LEYRNEVRRRELLEPRPHPLPLLLLLAIGSDCGVLGAVKKNVKRSSSDNKGGFRDHFPSRPWLERACCLGSDYGLLLPRGSRVLRLISGHASSITHQNEMVDLLMSNRVGIEIHQSCGVAGGRQFIAALSGLEVHPP